MNVAEEWAEKNRRRVEGATAVLALSCTFFLDYYDFDELCMCVSVCFLYVYV